MIALLSVILVLLSALFSGLNLGLMSLDVHELKRKILQGNQDAKKVYSVRKNGNLLLVSLLIGNVAVISALSIVLDTKYHGLVAGILTTALITLFGEIIPQALFSRYALKLGAKVVWLVKILITVMWPVAAPIAYVLNKVLGDELPEVYKKSELAMIIKEHGQHKQSGLDRDEVRIATGALTFGDKTIASVMTPKNVVTSVKSTAVIDHEKINELWESGHSRFPVTADANTIVGILYAKDLVKLEDFEKTAVQLARKNTVEIRRDIKLDDALNLFIKKRQHMFIVTDKQKRYVGIVTLEDVIEEILHREIVDEYDKYVDMRKSQ
jgi:metal transporter CNNM